MPKKTKELRDPGTVVRSNRMYIIMVVLTTEEDAAELAEELGQIVYVGTAKDGQNKFRGFNSKGKK